MWFGTKNFKLNHLWYGLADKYLFCKFPVKFIAVGLANNATIYTV